ncbi:MAG: hypothetical protein GXY11_06870 [Clostridiales bacterium]|nr:hypothetical protein [Clostridiales bacterium]
MNLGATAESIVGSLFAAAQAERESVDFIRARIEQRISERGFRRDVAGDCYSDLIETLAQAEHDGLGVFIAGRPGVGKTFLARCAFPSAPLVQCSQVGEGFALPDAPVVIIDDLGAEPQVYGREPVLQAFLGWYDTPPAKRSRLIITSNLRGEDVRRRYGERFISRARATLISVRITGEDHRSREGERANAQAVASADDPEVAREVRAFVRYMRNAGWHTVNAGAWVLMLAKQLDAPKAKAAGILIVDAWERERDADPERDEKLKRLASQERWVVERNERGLAMVREWRTGR